MITVPTKTSDEIRIEASREAVRSQLPGRQDGPADAYKIKGQVLPFALVGLT